MARPKPPQLVSGEPLISVIICTHNRAEFLRKAIVSVLGQDFPSSDYEIVVVDNASTDETRDVVTEFRASANVRYLFEEQLGLSAARNAGWRAARGRYAAFLDDDAVAMPGWLAAIREAFASASPAAGAVGGRVDPVWGGPRPDWLSDEVALSLTVVDWGALPKTIDDIRHAWLVGANMVVPKSLLAEIGGFHPWLDRAGSNLLSSGDIFLQKEIMRRNYSCLYHPSMAVQHLIPAARLNQHWFFRRYYWQGVSDAVMELIESTPSPGQRVSAAAVRGAAVLLSRRKLMSLLVPRSGQQKFEQKCFALLDLGYVSGLLGIARH